MRQSNAVATQRKPVIVRKFSRDWCAGYADADFGQNRQDLELLEPGGKVMRLTWNDIKWICFVRDLPGTPATPSASEPERLLHKRFAIRPRTAGLWLKLTLRDGEELEGLAANDRSLIDGAGLLLTPPDTRSNTQRIYVPRQAIEKLEVAGLIGAPQRRSIAHPVNQQELFPAEQDVSR